MHQHVTTQRHYYTSLPHDLVHGKAHRKAHCSMHSAGLWHVRRTRIRRLHYLPSGAYVLGGPVVAFAFFLLFSCYFLCNLALMNSLLPTMHLQGQYCFQQDQWWHGCKPIPPTTPFTQKPKARKLLGIDVTLDGLLDVDSSMGGPASPSLTSIPSVQWLLVLVAVTAVATVILLLRRSGAMGSAVKASGKDHNDKEDKEHENADEDENEDEDQGEGDRSDKQANGLNAPSMDSVSGFGLSLRVIPDADVGGQQGDANFSLSDDDGEVACALDNKR